MRVRRCARALRISKDPWKDELSQPDRGPHPHAGGSLPFQPGTVPARKSPAGRSTSGSTAIRPRPGCGGRRACRLRRTTLSPAVKRTWAWDQEQHAPFCAAASYCPREAGERWRAWRRRGGRPCLVLVRAQSEVSAGEGTAGSRLQVTLEDRCACAIPKSKGVPHLPWCPCPRARNLAPVVPGKAAGKVVGQPDVEPVGPDDRLEDVNARPAGSGVGHGGGYAGIAGTLPAFALRASAW
jgi:hypothetical protein